MNRKLLEIDGIKRSKKKKKNCVSRRRKVDSRTKVVLVTCTVIDPKR